MDKMLCGKVVLFGSGETLEMGRKIQRKLLSSLSQKQRVVILETPAGFQPNSAVVAQEIADAFSFSLKEFMIDITIVPARKKGTAFSPDDPVLLEPLEKASYIFLGPGSPTYAVKQLQNTKALSFITKRWEDGAALVFSSAAAMAMGLHTLPVYEIYKVGEELHWEKGLDLFSRVGLSLTVITHWNNAEGGEKTDTRYCFMGQARFNQLQKLLPKDTMLLGIDEHTAVIFDFTDGVFSVEGAGSAYVIVNGKTKELISETYYEIGSLQKGIVSVSTFKPFSQFVSKEKDEREVTEVKNLPDNLQQLLTEREKAKEQKDFKRADEIREIFRQEGYQIEDRNGTAVFEIKK